MVTKAHILETLRNYEDAYTSDVFELLDLRQLVFESDDPTSRSEVRGHITCSGLIVDQHDRIVLIQHPILNKWLAPGGHVEAGDSSLVGAAVREIEEEVGIPANYLFEVSRLTPACPVSIRRHTIPENSMRNEACHEHWDFSYLFRCQEVAGHPVKSESLAIQYIPPSVLGEVIAKRIQEICGGIYGHSG